MKFDNLNTLVKQDLKHNNVPMLVGEPGIGKSSWVEGFTASELQTRCFVLACNQLADKADLTGCRLVPIEGTNDYAQVFYPHIVIRNAITYAEEHPDETPVLFLDEINRTTPDVTSEALSIPTSRSIGNRKIPENLKVIIAGNDKGNVVALDKASITRFIMYHIEPDVTTFIQVNPNLNPYVLSVLKKNPNYIYMDAVSVTLGKDDDDDDDDDAADFEMEFEDGLEQITTPRTITAASRWLNEFTYDELMDMINTPTSDDANLLKEALIAHCGNTPFTMTLLDEIIASSMSIATQQTLVMTKPVSYDLCRKAKSRDELNDIFANLDNASKSELLIYTLYDKNDNKNILEVLAPTVTQIETKDIQHLIQLSQTHQIDKGNYDTLNGITCNATSVIKMLNL